MSNFFNVRSAPKSYNNHIGLPYTLANTHPNTDILILDKGKTVLQGNLKDIKQTYKANRVQINANENIDNYIKELNLEIENEKNNEYTIKITDEDIAHKLLNNVVSKGIEINKFEIMKPTLNDIFIEKVGE